MIRKPKFSVGQQVWSRQHGKRVRIRKIVFDTGHRLYGYFFHGLPMYWLEYNLRPLTHKGAPKESERE